MSCPDTLSPELWAVIARAALAADGDTVQAWSRLSLVSRTFRKAIAGGSTLRKRCSFLQTQQHAVIVTLRACGWTYKWFLSTCAGHWLPWYRTHEE